MKFQFKAKIYKTGINWCVDVPLRISSKMTSKKGYIKIKGKVNDFDFAKSLVPVKNRPHRLFVNLIMMKGGKTALGKVAHFNIEQDNQKKKEKYSIPKLLREVLKENKLTETFNSLTPSRKNDILKYLSFIRTEETMMKNITKLIGQLKTNQKSVRIP
jgi:hypothetical protein